ncbi:MAG: NYN domain-containing protein [Candidatus Rokubacteria bacterium]|nr:NYN domain-containing protein [Candidatus Rokubacteria bacterium]
MRWLIDGYNVIRREPDLRGAEAESLEAGRRALLARVAEITRRSTDRFTVVFDGAPGFGPASSGGRVEVVFSRPPESADDVLRRLARGAGSGAAVVSSDRAVLDAARRAGCPAVTAEDFLAALDGQDAEDDDGEDDDTGTAPPRRGNPRRLSKDARAAQRALRRLRSG